MPGGVNSPVRAMRSIGRDHPIFVDRGERAELVDVDGNRYVDWVCSWGPLILGHAHPSVVAAVTEAARRGTSYGAPTEGEVELAGEVVDRFVSVEMLRMVSSGTEASMSAIRLARAVTGRDTIVKFAGAYHGHVDGLLAEAGSGLATQGIPASPGVTTAQAADTSSCRGTTGGGGRGASPSTLPRPSSPSRCPRTWGWSRRGRVPGVAARVRTSGALLILDEVISGFRVAGAAPRRHSGSGRPHDHGQGARRWPAGGGLWGPRDPMERVAPAGDVYQAGTLSGNPLAVAAGLATLRELDAAPTAARRLTDRLAAGLRERRRGSPGPGRLGAAAS